ncbi:MAG: hypothetical protein RR505_10535 [Raoultibacter sp.]
MKHKRHLYREIGSMILSNFDAWLHNPRTLLMALFLTATSWRIVRAFSIGIASQNFSMHFDESIAWFAMTGFGSMALISLTFLVTISELPPKIAFQQFMLIRSSRSKWILAQILYCLICVIVILLLLLLLMAIWVMPYTVAGSGWSDSIRIANGMEAELAYVPQWIRSNFLPWQALLLSIVPIFSFLFTMSLTVLFFSLLGLPAIGPSLYAFVLFSSIIFMFENIPGFQPPMTFTTLMRIGYNYEDVFTQRLQTVFSIYGAFVVIQIIGILFVAHRMNIPTYALNKK